MIRRTETVKQKTYYGTDEEAKVHVMQLDRIAELDSADYPRNPANYGHFMGRGLAGRSMWLGGTEAKIDEVLSVGWPEGVALAQGLADKLRGTIPAPKSFKRRQRWAEDGDEPSWEREQQGHTEIWRTSKRDTMRGPVNVEIFAPWGGNANLMAYQLQWDGIVMAVLCDILESSGGYRVGITLNTAIRYSTVRYALIQLEVKRPELPLNLGSLVPVVAFPGVYRKHGINLQSTVPWDCSSGHGSNIEISELPRPLEALRKDAIVLRHCYSEQAARMEILRVLKMFDMETV